jgi:hypothetical protein
MACMPTKRIRGFPVLSLGFIILTLSPALSIAQAAQNPRVTTNAPGAQAARSFTFETFSIRPHKPGSPLLEREYLPDGYRASWVLENLIAHAYLGPYGVAAERAS